MKKNFKLMLVALTAMMTSSAFAAVVPFNDDNFKYEFDDAAVTVSGTKGSGDATVVGYQNPLTGAVEIPNTVTYKAGGITYTFKVAAIANNALNNQLLTAITIPANVKTIGDDVFAGCTNLQTITFAANSQLETIGNNAFATTRVAEYDFSPCTKLQGFPDELFIESGEKNTFVTKVIMPEGSTFKAIGTALASLPNLAETNLAKTKIQEVAASFLAADAKLKQVELPGTVKTINTDAFKGSAVDSLVINVASILPETTSQHGIMANAYSSDAADKAKLKKLILKGELKGTIESNAFNDRSGLTVLDLSGLSFGTNAAVKADAFGTLPNAITSITLGNIGDNGGTSAYTIQTNAFNGAKLATVTIGNITANLAIQGQAFNKGTTYTLTSVKIGNVYSGGLTLDAQAFMFAKIADGKAATIEMGNLRATSMTPIIGAGAFTFDAATANKANLTMKVGAIESAGKVFTSKAVAFTTDPLTVAITFDGNIEYDGIDVDILAKNDYISALTFNGKLAVGAIKAAAFAGIGQYFNPADPTLGKIKPTVTFNKSLAAFAVEAGAFDISTNTPNNKLIVDYKGTPEDASVYPFDQDAFGDGTASGTQPLSDDASRSVTLKIADADLKALIMSNQVSIDNPGTLNPDDDIIYRVILLDDSKAGMVVYLKTGTTTSYGRFDLESLKSSLTNGITIPRRQTLEDGTKVTYTLYSTYVEDDATNEVVTINMQPIPCTNGEYVIPKAKIGNATDGTQIAVLIIKAVGTKAESTPVQWEDDATGTVSEFFTDNELQVYNKANPGAMNITNQQLIDLETAAPSPFDNLWNTDGTAQEDIYFLSNPADHKGITANTWDIKKANVYVAPGSFNIVTTHYANAAAARIVWLDGGEETTGISTVKSVENDAVIYNMAGQQVDGNYKGIVIKNGKKMILK